MIVARSENMFEIVGYGVLWLPRKLFHGALAKPGEEVFGSYYSREGGQADFIVGLITCALVAVAGVAYGK